MLRSLTAAGLVLCAAAAPVHAQDPLLEGLQGFLEQVDEVLSVLDETPLSGTGANDILVGGSGPDLIKDPAGGDTDNLYDGPGTVDDATDVLDTTDGDNNDRMWGGLNDTYRGDPGDQIYLMVRPPEGAPFALWTGTVAEYERMRRLVNWVKARYSALWPQPGDTPYTEYDALALAGWELFQVDPRGPLVQPDDHLAVAPYEWVETLPSPGGWLNWFPEAYGSTAVEDGLALSMPLADWDAAVEDALDVLLFAYNQPLMP